MEFTIEFTVTTSHAITVEADSLEEALEQIEDESSFDELESTYSDGYIHCDELDDEYSTETDCFPSFYELLEQLKKNSKKS